MKIRQNLLKPDREKQSEKGIKRNGINLNKPGRNRDRKGFGKSDEISDRNENGNMAWNKGMDEYLDTVKGQIRDKHAQEFVAEELKEHILDQAGENENTGMTKEAALQAAVTEMGDPVAVGTQMDRIHRPHLEWKFLILVTILSLASIVVQFSVNTPQGAGRHLIHVVA